MNSDGQFDERKLEASELPPPPAKPKKRAAKSRAKKASPRIKTASSASADAAVKSTRVKVTKQATKTYADGQSAMDHDMIKFECPKCGSSRVGKEDTKSMQCGLCSVSMRRYGSQ